MMTYIISKIYVRLLVVRFVLKAGVYIVREQNLYGNIEKYLFSDWIMRRLCYPFVFQKILWNALALRIPTWFIQLIVFFIFRTSTISVVGEENLGGVEKERERLLFAFWHGDYTLLLSSIRTHKSVALVHSSLRGNYIAQIFSAFNYQIIRTSADGRSLRAFIRAIGQGYAGFIAVDGPQGPAHKAKPGVIYIARKAGAKIIPLGIEARRGFVFKGRWDNHVIPLPFNRITVHLGKSIDVKPGDSLEMKEAELTRSLRELTNSKKGRASLLPIRQ